MTRDEWIAALSRWVSAGMHRFDDDVIMIGGDKDAIPPNWQHEFYPPVPADIRKKYLQSYPLLGEFPYWKTLKDFNGLRLFSDSVFLLGIRSNHRPLSSPAVIWDLGLQNVEEYPTYGESRNAIVIGGAHLGELAFVFVQKRSGEVQAVGYYSKETVFEWENLDQLLMSEILRLNGLTLDDGTIIDAKARANYRLVKT